jgi:hypothetical protein
MGFELAVHPKVTRCGPEDPSGIPGASVPRTAEQKVNKLRQVPKQQALFFKI